MNRVILLVVHFLSLVPNLAGQQDTLYSHWPKAPQETVDPVQAKVTARRVLALLDQPLLALSDRQTGKILGKGPGWTEFQKASRNFEKQHLAPAFKHAEASLSHARKTGDAYLEMRAQEMLGSIARDVFMGSSLKAVPYHEQALVLARQLQDTTYEIRQLLALADNYGQAGKKGRFLSYSDSAIQLLYHFDVPRSRMRLGAFYGSFLEETGDHQEAKRLYQSTLDLARRMKEEAYVQHVHLQLFYVAVAEHNARAAAAALEAYRIAGAGVKEDELHEMRYQLEKLQGHKDQAFHHLEQAYNRIGDDYVRRNADLLAGWETALHTREKEMEVESQRALLKSQSRTRRALWGILFLLSALVLVSGGAWYVQRRAKVKLRRQHATIERQAEELRALDQLKSRFFANASHELRTPLTLILGPLTQVLQERNLPSGVMVSLLTVRKSATQLLGLVNDILDLSKLSVTEPALYRQPTILKQYIEEITGAFQPLAESRRIALEMKYSLPPESVFGVDRNKTQKILNNLLGNAFKFTPNGGLITVQVKENEPALLQIEVADSGSGIHPDDLPNIFNLYYQTKYPDAKAEGGTGIGLTLSRELAVAMGGDLRADNRPEGGAVFTLTLPAEELAGAEALPPAPFTAAPLAAAATAWKPASGPANAPLILLVEDNIDLQQFLIGLLQQDYRLSLANNGQEALRCLNNAAEIPDLILTDLMMPVMDGFQLLETLRQDERWRAIPIIMLTARAEQQDRMRAFRTGVDDYLIKPFEPEELFVRLENVLRNQAARKEWRELQQDGRLPDEAGSQEMDGGWLRQFEHCVRANLSDAQFNVERLAELMHSNRKALYQQVREHTGMSVNQYIQEMRLLVAREQIEAGKVTTVRDLAQSVGFRTADYFSRLYRERFGKSPADIW